jgi:hypothetical protein
MKKGMTGTGLSTLIAAGCLALAACETKYGIESFQAPTAPLSASGGFYVVVPKDGTYGRKVYEKSGATTAQVVAAALSARGAKVIRGSRAESKVQAIENAKKRDAKYVFEPTILSWEDRATQWSGRPDKLSVKFTVYDTASAKVLASTVVHGSAGFMPGGRPDDLLDEPARKFVDQLFP